MGSFNHFKIYSSLALSIIVVMGNHHLCLVSEVSHYSKRKLHTCKAVFIYYLLLLMPLNMELFFLTSLSRFFFASVYRYNLFCLFILYPLTCLNLFISSNNFSVCVCMCVYEFLIYKNR